MVKLRTHRRNAFHRQISSCNNSFIKSIIVHRYDESCWNFPGCSVKHLQYAHNDKAQAGDKGSQCIRTSYPMDANALYNDELY